jgi:hypothetical protein
MKEPTADATKPLKGRLRRENPAQAGRTEEKWQGAAGALVMTTRRK